MSMETLHSVSTSLLAFTCVMNLLCTFQAMESQIPCSAHRHWPVSTLKSSQKASCIQPTSRAALGGKEMGEERARALAEFSFHRNRRERGRKGGSGAGT